MCAQKNCDKSSLQSAFVQRNMSQSASLSSNDASTAAESAGIIYVMFKVCSKPKKRKNIASDRSFI